ncbi:MAG: hypothetical protein SGJ09_00515 [Phycisphaerae bacterium]|nr:hypothetical protein [Phycisphaerae bacterium]
MNERTEPSSETRTREPGPRELKSRVFARVFVIVFAVASIATFVWGWTIIDSVRRTATDTDRCIRTVAWATLAYASENGRFPLSDDELFAFGSGPDSIATMPRSAGAGVWPTKRADALGSGDPAPLADCFRAVLVVWGDDGSMPPLLTPNELPTLRGTEGEVNRWLDAFRHRSDARGND